MKNTSRFVVALATLALGLNVQTAMAASINNHYEVDLENYRACKVDANGHRLSTCSNNDVRSGSKYYLADGTSGSISVTSTGTVKARIDGLALDTGVSYACTYNTTFLCDTGHGVCLTGPGADSVPKRTCANNGECSANACADGPQTNKGCNPSNPDAACRSLASVNGIASVVFGGNQPGITFPGGYPAFTLIGDGADAENGCTKICTMNTDATGKIDSNSLNADCQVSGDTGCTFVEPYHVVKVLDRDGKVVAVPSVGPASLIATFVGITDPAKYGDVCRSGSPPADCAYDQ